MIGFNKLQTSVLFQFELHLFVFLLKNCIHFLCKKNRALKIQGEPLSQGFLNLPGQSTWTSFNKHFKLLFFYTFYSHLECIPCTSCTSRCFTLNFCHIFLFNLSHKNFWTFSGRALELLATNFLDFSFYSFFSHTKCTPQSKWTCDSYQTGLLSISLS